MSSEISSEIDPADICERLVGITPVYLQNFLQRGSYGLRSSISQGKVRSQRRLFSPDDVYGIALVWLLFESGLRSDPIARILKDITRSRTVNANKAAEVLRESGQDYLVVIRTPRRPSKSIADKPDQQLQFVQKVRMASEKSLAFLLEEDVDRTILLIPVGDKFADLRTRLEILFEVR
jgi:hypothetical protein